jgi:hypothetical protein
VIGTQIKRLAQQSAIYGLGGIISRLLAVALLPLYTSYLGTTGFGKIETVVALTTVLAVVLRLGISSAFFRFYFDSDDPDRRRLVVRTVLLVHDGDGDRGARRRLPPRRADRAPAATRRRSLARPRRLRRALGADELRAADVAVPRGGTTRRVREPRASRTSSSPSARRSSWSSASTRERPAPSSETSSGRSSCTSCCSATAATSSASSSTAASCAP